MENLLDMLIPIILVVGWVIKGLFSGNTEEDESPPPRSRSTEDESYPDTEYEARQRRIQEEIRRKIMERQQADGRGATAPQSQDRIQEQIRRQFRDELSKSREAVEGGATTPPELPHQQRPVVISADQAEAKRRRVQERLKQRKERQKEVAERVHETPEDVHDTPGGFSWDESERAMDVQRARLEETKRQAALLQSQLASSSQGEVSKVVSKRGRGSYRGPVREKLRDPRAARDAIIYSEVLGKPVGLREG
ncbi:MAG: hypothetical protein ACPGJU_08885 [Coraliomargarita sp.]